MVCSPHTPVALLTLFPSQEPEAHWRRLTLWCMSGADARSSQHFSVGVYEEELQSSTAKKTEQPQHVDPEESCEDHQRERTAMRIRASSKPSYLGLFTSIWVVCSITILLAALYVLYLAAFARSNDPSFHSKIKYRA